MERMEAIGNGGLGGDKRSRDWAKLEGFLRQSQRINEMKLMKSMGWRKQAHKCWLYCFSSSLLMCFSNYTPPPEIQFQPTPSLTLHLVFLPSQSLAQFSRSHPSSTPLPLVLTPLILVFLSLPLHTCCLSHPRPLPSCLPLLTAGTVQLSLGNCTTDRQRRGALLTLKATLYGQQCRQHTAAVRLCVDFTGFVRQSDKLYRARHLWVKELIEMDISYRIQLREWRGEGGGGGGGRPNTPQKQGKTNTLIPISIWINVGLTMHCHSQTLQQICNRSNTVPLRFTGQQHELLHWWSLWAKAYFFF